MEFNIKLPSDPSLKPDPKAAKRLAEILRELRASQEIIDVAESTAKAAEEASEQPPLKTGTYDRR